ncbi:MAG: hypothetical protein ACREDZ_08990 [Kiloniellales bacterium]
MSQHLRLGIALIVLVVFLHAVDRPAAAEERSDRAARPFGDLPAISSGSLGGLSAQGLADTPTLPDHAGDLAVILWDETKPGRPKLQAQAMSGSGSIVINGVAR